VHAVQAHRLSVHGRFEVPKPRWAAHSKSQANALAAESESNSAFAIKRSGSDLPPNDPNDPHECAVCGLLFASEDLLLAHVENGMQPRSFEEATEESSLLQCGCGRRFTEERALRQHQNACARDKPVPDLLLDDFSSFESSMAAATAAAVNVNANAKATKRIIKHAEVQASTDDLLASLPDKDVQPALAVLSPRVSDARLSKFESILNTRTNAIRFVFENPANVNNCYAALRTFDAVGVQFADIIVQPDQYVDSGRLVKMKSSMGALKWMSVTQHSDTRSCLLALKAEGYLIVVTDIHRAGSIPIDQVDFNSSKLAIVLGNEQFGTSEEAKSLSDVCFYLPMAGFAESLNLAAFCALLCGRLQVSGALQVRNSVRDGTIPSPDKRRILLKWMERSLPPGNALRLLQAEGLCCVAPTPTLVEA
jgi:tRNA (guanosine-2'-O-)-methyltransferase